MTIQSLHKLRLKLETPVIVSLYRGLARLLGNRYNFLLLTTIGRKSQRQRTVPLVYMRDGNDYVLVASNVGSDVHPAWFLNLKNNAHAQIQIGKVQIPVVAEETDTATRQQLWANWLRTNPGYAQFQAKTKRQFPVVRLKAE